MFHSPDANEAFLTGVTGELSQSTCYLIEHDGVNLDDVIRLDEDRQAIADDGNRDFCLPFEDWIVD